jgi:acyl-CoA thioester hydrolase
MPAVKRSIMPDQQYIYSLEFLVRDYECDLQGVVNNANYQHYLEHARHGFMISREIDFEELHRQGIDLIVSQVKIDYKYPLRSRDRFEVRINIRREGNVRLVFEQTIFRIPDEKLIVVAEVTGVATKNGRPVRPDDIVSRLGL